MTLRPIQFHSSRIAIAVAALSIVPSIPAFAQDDGGADVPHAHDPHEQDDTIVVTSGGLEQLDMLAGISLIKDAELQRNMAGQVGEVLAKLPGVSASGFAPGASRPVLRGFQGERVRVLVDGIGSIDASNTSADHAVTIDPLTAQSIEVLRGPAVLLYGSSAIGGAVNVIDRRIPHTMPRGGMRIDGVLSADTASDLREAGASFDLAAASNLAWHVDGSYRRTNDLEIAGYALTQALRDDLLADAAEEAGEGHADEAAELTAAANLRGTVPDSASRTLSAGTGLTWFSGLNSIGVSVSYYDTQYGVPILPGAHHHHDEEAGGEEEEEGHSEESVSINLEQIRADLRGEFHISDGFLDDLVTRWGYSDYTHTELEGDAIGTTFNVEGVEGRAELIQREQSLAGAVWNGSIGGQFFHRDFEAIGEEAFVPPNQTTQFALFTLQELRRGPFEVEIGARWENTKQQATAPVLVRDFDTVSGALGLSWTFASGIRTGLNLSRAERAPSAEELFADGPHIATSQYELGDPDLATEAAWGVEAYARATLGDADIRVAAYRNWFDRFIYLADTGTEQDGLELSQYLQQDAKWEGIEAEANVPLFGTDNGELVADLRGSYIRATLADGSPVPRIPPLSLLGALEWKAARMDYRAEVEVYGKQSRTAPNETPTAGFAHMNLSANFRPFADNRISLMVQANNIFDAEGRRHASFTKDFVPLAGRNIKMSLRMRL